MVGKHYFCVQGEELEAIWSRVQNETCSPTTPMLYFWTRLGTLHHAKSLNTEQAWKVYETLEETYFLYHDSQHEIPQTFSQALRLAANAQERIEQLEQQAKLDAPKVTTADALLTSDTVFSSSVFAKLLIQNGVATGRNRILAEMKTDRIFMQHSDFYEPVQRYANMGLFKILTKNVPRSDGSVSVKHTTKFTTKGLHYFLNFYLRKYGKSEVTMEAVLASISPLDYTAYDDE